MIIETRRLQFTELNLTDVNTLADIAKDMAWNDTVNILLRTDLTSQNFKECGKEDLLQYKNKIKLLAENILKEAPHKQNISSLIPQNIIPEQYWHINFSLLKPDFKKSALNFIKEALKRQSASPRYGFWLGIKDKKSNTLIGATTISTKIINDNNIAQIGHSGQFIHPDYQRKGYISETKAVMVDFMYKYLIDMNITPVPPQHLFYTTCDKLNVGSQALQKKSGASASGYAANNLNKIKFYTDRNDITSSPLMQKEISWKAELDNGKKLISKVSVNELKIIHTIQSLENFSTR